jgi:hypothetical protein
MMPTFASPEPTIALSKVPDTKFSSVEDAVAMYGSVMQAGIAAHEGQGMLEVFVVELDPLALVATLGDGVKLFEDGNRAAVARSW